MLTTAQGNYRGPSWVSTSPAGVGGFDSGLARRYPPARVGRGRRGLVRVLVWGVAVVGVLALVKPSWVHTVLTTGPWAHPGVSAPPMGQTPWQIPRGGELRPAGPGTGGTADSAVPPRPRASPAPGPTSRDRPPSVDRVPGASRFPESRSRPVLVPRSRPRVSVAHTGRKSLDPTRRPRATAGSPLGAGRAPAASGTLGTGSEPVTPETVAPNSLSSPPTLSEPGTPAPIPDPSAGSPMSESQVYAATGSHYVARESQTPMGQEILRELLGSGSPDDSSR